MAITNNCLLLVADTGSNFCVCKEFHNHCSRHSYDTDDTDISSYSSCVPRHSSASGQYRAV